MGSTATPNGLAPVGTSASAVRLPELILKTETVLAATLVENRNLSLGSTASRRTLLWHDVLHVAAGVGNADVGLRAAVVALMLNGTTLSAM